MKEMQLDLSPDTDRETAQQKIRDCCENIATLLPELMLRALKKLGSGGEVVPVPYLRAAMMLLKQNGYIVETDRATASFIDEETPMLPFPDVHEHPFRPPDGVPHEAPEPNHE